MIERQHHLDQMTLGLDLSVNVPNQDILQKLDLKGYSLELAQKLHEVGGTLPDETKFYSLSFWREGSIEKFLRGAKQLRERAIPEVGQRLDRYKRELESVTEELKSPNNTVGFLKIEKVKIEKERLERNISRQNTILQRFSSPVIEVNVDDSPAEWSYLIRGLTLSQRSTIGQAFQRPKPEHYFSGLSTYALGDFRADHPDLTIIDGMDVKRLSNKSFIYSRDPDGLRRIFLSVALRKT